MQTNEHQIIFSGGDSLSIVDGRNILFTHDLRKYLSESALHQNRAVVMIATLIHLSKWKFPGFPEISESEAHKLHLMVNASEVFNSSAVIEYDHIGRNGRLATEHDVKAVEYYLRELLETEYPHLIELIHFPMTSEDVNNIAWNLMIREGINRFWMPALLEFTDGLASLSKTIAAIPCPGRTHGMPASPTTFGKKFSYFLDKIQNSIETIATMRLSAKWSGPVGNFNAIKVVAPDFPIEDCAKALVEYFDFVYLENEHQRNSHQHIVRLLHEIKILHVFLIDFCKNMWLLGLLGWIKMKPIEGNVGSSVMPQKVNPWRFEDAEALLEQANRFIDGYAEGLLLSNLERDMTDHTWERSYGEVFGKSIAAIKLILIGFQQIEISSEKALSDLNENPEVLAEMIQVAGRMLGITDIYTKIKDVTRGKVLSLGDIHQIIDDHIPDETMQQRLKNVTPATYVGNAAEITLQTVERYQKFKHSIMRGGFIQRGQTHFLSRTTGIEAVLFDFDGTLHFGDKDELFARLSAIATMLGMEFPEEEIKEFGNRSDFQEMKRLMVEAHNRKGSNLTTEKEFQRVNDDEVTGSFDHLFTSAQWAKPLLHLLKEVGIKTGLVTTRGPKSLPRLLKLHQFEGCFDIVINSGDVKERKPAPNPIAFALQQINVAPQNAMFIGDKQYDDIGGANALGMFSVLISTDPYDPLGAIPTLRCNNLNDVIRLFNFKYVGQD